MKATTLKIILLTAALVVAVFLAQAQDKKISQLPALPSVSGGEAIPLAISGTNYYVTPNQLKTWLNIVGYVPLAGTNAITAPLSYTGNVSGSYSTYSLIDLNYANNNYAPLVNNYLSKTLNSAKIFVGNASNVATGVTPTLNSSAGTFTLSNAGQFTFPDATNSVRGFLNPSDWTIFNNKQNAITTGTTSQYFRGDLSLATFPTNVSSFTNDAGYLTSIAGITAGGDLSSTYVNPTVAKIKGNTIPVNAAGVLTNNGSGVLSWVAASPPLTFTASLSVSSNTVSLFYGTGLSVSSGSLITSAIPNSSLSNSTFTVNGTAMALGTSSTVTADAGTLTNTILNSTVVTSSLTTVGTVTTGIWNSGIAPAVGTITTAATITINTDNYNMYTVTSLSTATTFTVPTGSPKAGQPLIIRIKDNGTARALSFSTGANGFRFSSDFPAPTTTTLSKTMYLGFRWNEADSKWDNISPYIDNF